MALIWNLRCTHIDKLSQEVVRINVSLNCIYSIKFKYCDNYIHVVNKFGILKKANMLILIHLLKSMQYKYKAATQ